AENIKPVFLRNYRDALLLADQTVIDAINLTLLVRAKSDSLRNSLTIGIPYLKNILGDYKNRFSYLPVSKKSQHETLTGELLLLESEYASARGDFILASKKMNQAAGKIENAKSTISGIITDYLAGIPIWQKWVEEALNESRKEKATLIVIEKLEHYCTVYTAGELLDRYKIELGPNWIGPKTISGDKATPEGIYTIVKKKIPPHTKYYKALELNYPNDTDRQRFEAGIKNGTLPALSHIGRLIEIHGGGGQGFNWTDGCIALNNNDMDKMYNLVETHTKVIIVGSLKMQHHLLYDQYLSK
ncbi:MAG: murein L,D-transpeptidase family protein, partial [Calditrichaceae bacterium]